MRSLPFCAPLLVFFCSVVSAQDSGTEKERSINIIRHAVQLHNENKYDSAIAEFSRVHRNDSNYYLASVEKLNTMLASGKPEEGLELCEHLLMLKNDYTPNILIYKGDFLDLLGRHEEAEKVYQSGTNDYPLNHLFYYEAAVAKINRKKQDEAFDLFVQSAKTNPFHASSHQQLAILAYRNNNLPATMLAFQFYLVCDPLSKRAKRVVVDLEKIAKLELETDTIIPVKKLEKENDFSELQSILRSKYALSEKYKAKTNLNFDLLKQMQLLIESIGKYKSVKGFYNEFYGKFFAELNNQKYTEHYLYYSLKGMELEKVNKWIEKNKKKMEEFELWAYNYICTEMASFPEQLNNRTETVPHWYYNNNISGAGVKNKKNQSHGYWNYYYRNGIKKAEGEFVNDVKTGTWKYYYENGGIKEKVVYENGEQKRYNSFYQNNNPKVEVALTGDKVVGVKKTFFPNGNTYALTPYLSGEISGDQSYYFRNGILRYTIRNDRNIISGDLLEYFDNGKKYQAVKFINNNREGLSRIYHNNNTNTVKEEGNYTKNKAVGEWKTYYRSGKIAKVQNFNNEGQLHGESKEYFENGNIDTEESYSNNKIQGVSKVYSEDGKLWQEFVYKKGKLMEYRAYSKEGVKIADSKINGRNFSLVLYHPNGTKRREGKVSDGELEGTWKDYSVYGVLRRETNYREGRFDGKYIEYHNNGNIDVERNYTNGTENGSYKSFYLNGKLYSEGRVVNGNYDGYLTTYHRDGSISSRQYYAEGELDGWNEYYDVSGKLSSEELYSETCLIKLVYHDTTGKVSQNIDLPGGTGLIEKKTMEGKTIFKRNFVKDYPDGISETYFPGDILQSRVTYKNGGKEGLFLEYNISGQLINEISYFNNKKNGTEKSWNDEGKLKSVYFYENGKLHGNCTSYYANGKVYRYISYNEGNTEGESDMFDENGELVYRRYFHNDLLTGYTYYGTDGKLLPMKEVPAGNTKITCYFKNGKKSFEAGYANGDLHGKRIIYDSNGKVREESEFYYDVLNGPSVDYYASGAVKAKEHYYYGRLHGKKDVYYENGKIKSERYYRNGELHGWNKMYDRNGKILRSILYYNGNPIFVS